ncbi:MAG: DUF4145 domain-containing protein [Candidatus Hodarchaeota archaeon]
MELNPEYDSRKFKCPHCYAIAQQEWFNSTKLTSIISNIYNHIFLNYRSQIQDYKQEAIKSFLRIVDKDFPNQLYYRLPTSISIAKCQACNNYSIWVNQKIIYPKSIPIDPPNYDLNDEIKSLYNEAATIFVDSPKGATALLRLALQMLLKQIGKDGKNINNDIKELVSEGLSPRIQKALDLVRVIGNNAVHPGQINLKDNKDVAFKLFKILNMIADEIITKPKEIDKLYDDIVPYETKEHINLRDSKTS